MIDSTISRARMLDLSSLGRCGRAEAGGAGSRAATASPRRCLTEASSLAEASARRPRPPSSRPARDDLVESIISWVDRQRTPGLWPALTGPEPALVLEKAAGLPCER